MPENAFAVGAAPWTPLWELTAVLQTPFSLWPRFSAVWA